jgi:hypothetical protein
MLWGNGNQGSQDWSRLSSFKAMTQAPPYIFGFYEPDCLAPMSSDIDPSVGKSPRTVHHGQKLKFPFSRTPLELPHRPLARSGISLDLSGNVQADGRRMA